MLTKADKDKIIELRSQDFSYHVIHEKLGFAEDTIMKVCKEEERRKIKEIEEGQRESKKAEESMAQREGVSFDSLIQKVRQIPSDIDNVIKSGKLKVGDRKEWEKRKQDIRELLAEEVDDVIPEVREDAVKARDKEWNELLEQRYVKKDVVEDLKKRINEMETTIINLRNENEDKDDLITKNQQEISWINASNEREKETLNNRIRDLFWQKVDLEEKIGDLNDYVGNYLDDLDDGSGKTLGMKKQILIGMYR